MIRIHGAVVTGFELAACEELREKFGVEASSIRGAVFFDLPNTAALSEILSLRSVDSLYAVVDGRKLEAVCDKDQTTALQSIANLIVDPDWSSGLKALEYATQQPLPGGYQRAMDALSAYRSTLSVYSGDKNGLPSYRVTCYRPGAKELHSFGSMDAARVFGNVVNNCFGWTPKMEKFDIEVVSVELALNKASLHFRNIVDFGPTTLRPTICHGLLRMAAPRPGEIVVDPLCGGGSIPLEAATSWSDLIIFGGDYHTAAVGRCAANLQALYKNANTSPMNQVRSPIDFFQWDSTKLPLANESVDCIVTDLPFGKRLHTDNRHLYPALLLEWARVLKTSGRVAALTHDRRNLDGVLMRHKPIGRLWHIKESRNVNIGGLICVAYLLVKR